MLYETSSTAIAVFAVFVAFVLGLSFYLGRKSQSAKGYYAAHGQINWFVNGVAFAGDYLSAASFLGICGMIAFYGYDGFLYSIGYLAGWVVALFVIAEPIKRLGKFGLEALDLFLVTLLGRGVWGSWCGGGPLDAQGHDLLVREVDVAERRPGHPLPLPGRKDRHADNPVAAGKRDRQLAIGRDARHGLALDLQFRGELRGHHQLARIHALDLPDELRAVGQVDLIGTRVEREHKE